VSEWQPIEGHDGYSVSRDGQVKGPRGRLLTPWLNDQGYPYVRLGRPRRMARVHRLVAAAFLPNPEGLPIVNHRDNDRANCCADNLEWATQWANLDHAAKQGRMQRDYWIGKRSPNAKLTDEQAAEVRAAYARGGVSWADLGHQFNLGKKSIGRIVKGESYV
jgi:hypothetical protein